MVLPVAEDQPSTLRPRVRAVAVPLRLTSQRCLRTIVLFHLAPPSPYWLLKRAGHRYLSRNWSQES